MRTPKLCFFYVNATYSPSVFETILTYNNESRKNFSTDRRKKSCVKNYYLTSSKASSIRRLNTSAKVSIFTTQLKIRGAGINVSVTDMWVHVEG